MSQLLTTHKREIARFATAEYIILIGPFINSLFVVLASISSRRIETVAISSGSLPTTSSVIRQTSVNLLT